MKRRQLLQFGALAVVAPKAALAAGVICPDCGGPGLACQICLAFSDVSLCPPWCEDCLCSRHVSQTLARLFQEQSQKEEDAMKPET